MKALYNFLKVVAASFLLVACAQVVSPSGGAKDTTPPKILSSEPQNFSINYASKTIEMEFDEYIQLRSFNQEFTSSPPLLSNPKTKLNGKHLTIQFEDTLLPGVTYQFNFGKAIVDLHESNPLDSNLFVVSTGDFIDSLNLKGTVKNAFTLAPEKDVLVYLYKDLSDSIPMLQKPLYNTRTNDKGSFQFKYVAVGTYRLVALKDISGNALFEPEAEEFAFESTFVQPSIAGSTDTTRFDLVLFAPKKAKQFLKEFKVEPPGKISFLFNLPVATIDASCAALTGKKDWFIQDFTLPTDSFVYWTQGLAGIDTIQFTLKAEGIDTTISIATSSFDASKSKSLGGKGAKSKVAQVSGAKVGDAVKWDGELSVSFVVPIAQFDGGKQLLLEGKDTIQLNQSNWKVAKNLRDYAVSYPWKVDSSYILLLPDSTIFDIYGLANDTTLAKFKVLGEKNFGSVFVIIQHEKAISAQFVVELLDAQKKVVKTFTGVKNGDKINLDLLPVGNFSLRLIEDANANTIWDTGDYLKNIQPEKVWLFQKPIEVKGGFEEEIIWQIQ